MKGLAILLTTFGAAAAGAEEVAWRPQTTWVFAVGVLQFDDPGLASWPDEGRVDAVMLDAFRTRGVPDEQIVFIKDKQATARSIERKFVELLKQTGPDDTLVFYYAGHGTRNYRDPARPVSFVTFDTASSWQVREIVTTIERDFSGSRALLLADCCHSGALAVESSRRSGRIGYAALTSARASARSTGNWTFTECLVDMLNGKPTIDLDADGRITFQEAARHCDLEMAFCENQRVGYSAKGGFSGETLMSMRRGTLPARVGERCEGLDEGSWWKVKILDAKDDELLVHWIGWDRSYDAWVAPDRLREYEPRQLAPGARVEIEWSKTWYPGRVLKSELGLHLVHYEGYPNSDDEWVPIERLR